MRILLLAGLFLLGGTALAVEEPSYEVLRSYEAFELRQYPAQLMAETEVSGEFSEVGNQAFRILADYIFGNNRSQSKIAMTAPVSMQPETIAMTAPVTQTATTAEGAFVFSFLMPAKFTRETLPVPNDARVRIREIPARLLAARRYSGTWSESRYRKQEAALLDAVREARLTILGEPIFARYNAPFWPWFLRRNEVLLEVSAPPKN